MVPHLMIVPTAIFFLLLWYKLRLRLLSHGGGNLLTIYAGDGSIRFQKLEDVL